MPKTKWTDEEFMAAAEAAFIESDFEYYRRLKAEERRLAETLVGLPSPRRSSCRAGLRFTDEEFRRLAEEAFL